MSIRRTDSQRPTIRPTSVSENSPRNAAKSVSGPRAIKDGFDTTTRRPSELARAEQTQTLVPPKPGRLPLNSVDAQVAIQKSIAHLDPAASGQRTLLATPANLVAKNVERDELGMTHVRLDRQHEGVKVFGEQVITHLDASGKVVGVTGELSDIPAGLGSQEPRLSHSEAIDLARQEFGAKPDRQPHAERVIYQDQEGTYHLAYRVEISQIDGQRDPRRMNYLLDANTGKMLEVFNALDGFSLKTDPAQAQATGTANVPPTAEQPPASREADDTSLYSGKVDLSTKQNPDGTYSLEDTTRGKGVVTYDALNREQARGQTRFTDDNDVWGEATDPERARAAVDAHFGAAMTYDMLKDVLGRDSIDGAGEKLVSYVHVGNNFVNAYWDGEKMSYGDGNGRDAGPLTALDIAGHEIAHGLTERTAGLIYSGESGGLNESMSDIFGAGVEWYAAQKNPGVTFNWTVGETAWTPGNGNEDGLRYMDDPTRDGYSIDHYSQYPRQTEVHGSSGISNNAFYLLVNGGTNRTSGIEVKDGIGMEKGLKIFYRALAHYMTPRTNFSQARAATIQAATDLYGPNSPEVQKVKESWTAVGVE